MLAFYRYEIEKDYLKAIKFNQDGIKQEVIRTYEMKLLELRHSFTHETDDLYKLIS